MTDRERDEADWMAWQLESGMAPAIEPVVAGDVDAPPAGELQGTEGAKPRRSQFPAKHSPAPRRYMTAAQYKAACEKLGITVYASAKVLGISQSMAQRYAKDQWPIPETVAKLLQALVALKDRPH